MYLPILNRKRGILNDFRQLQNEVNHLFNSTVSTSSVFPKVNLFYANDDLILTAEVPGVDPKEIDISIQGNILSLSGKRERTTVAEDAVLQRTERASGNFSRTIDLPVKIEVKDIDATYKNGILKVKLPRAEEDKPKKISIKSE